MKVRLKRYFLDTTLVIAVANKKDEYHKKGVTLLGSVLREVQSEKLKAKIYTSEYIFDESISVVLSIMKDKSSELRRRVIKKIDRMINGPGFIEVLRLDKTLYMEALTYLRKYDTISASFTDWTSVALMKDLGIRGILSFNEDFDEISKLPSFSYVKRIEVK